MNTLPRLLFSINDFLRKNMNLDLDAYTIAELSILISFLCFLAIVVKKVWPLLINSLDAYIEKVKKQIDSAEKLREDSANALAQANRISSNIQEKVEEYRKKSERRVSQLEEENRRYLQMLKEKADQSLNTQLKAELSKQKGMLVDRLADLITEKLSERVKESSHEVVFSKEDLKKLI